DCDHRVAGVDESDRADGNIDRMPMAPVICDREIVLFDQFRTARLSGFVCPADRLSCSPQHRGMRPLVMHAHSTASNAWSTVRMGRTHDHILEPDLPRVPSDDGARLLVQDTYVDRDDRVAPRQHKSACGHRIVSARRRVLTCDIAGHRSADGDVEFHRGGAHGDRLVSHSHRERARNPSMKRAFASSPPGALPDRHTGGSTPRSTSLSAVLRMSHWRVKALANVETAPISSATPSTETTASPTGTFVSMCTSTRSWRFSPDGCRAG